MRRMYSEAELRKFIQEHGVDVVASLVDKDVKVKTIEQSEANWRQSVVEATLSAHGVSAGLTLEAIFNDVEIINGILYVVGINKITNSTESQITMTYEDYVEFEITLPESIAEKIIDFSGKSVKENSTENISIDFKGSASRGSSYFELNSRLQNLSGANKMKIRYAPNSNINVSAGQSVIYEDRLFLTIL